jgi:hypothetical protein
MIVIVSAAGAVGSLEKFSRDGGEPFAQFPAEFLGVCLLAGSGDAGQVKTDSHDGAYFFPGE